MSRASAAGGARFGLLRSGPLGLPGGEHERGLDEADGRPGAPTRGRDLMAAGNRKRGVSWPSATMSLMTSKTDGTVGW
jgi:hypothetical protein